MELSSSVRAGDVEQCSRGSRKASEAAAIISCSAKGGGSPMSEINNDRRFRISIRNAVQRVGFLGKAGFRRVRRGTVVARIVLLGSIFAAMVAAKGEESSFLSFLYNGIFFPNPNGASQTYSTNGRDRKS